MTQGTNVQQKFGGGELDPKLHERYDIQQYDASVGDSLNVMSTNKGDLISRPGTELVKQNTTGESVRIIPFIFSNGEAYRLEFTNQKLKIFQGSTQITSTTRFTFDSANYGPSSSVNHYAGGENPHTFPYQVGDSFAVDSLSTGTWNIEYDPGAIATTGSDQFEIKSINYTQLPAGSGAPIVDDIRIQEIGQSTELNVDSVASTLPASIYWEFTHTEWTSPYTEDELQDIQFAGVGDLMFFTHENHQPMKLTRVGSTDFLFHPHFTLKGPWRPSSTYGIEWDVDAVAGLSVQDKGTQFDCAPEEHISEVDYNSLDGRMVRVTDHPIDTVYKRTWAVGQIVTVNETDGILDDFRSTVWWEMKRDPTVTGGYPGSYILGTQARVDNKRVDDLRIGYLFEEAQADGTGGWPRCVAIWENRLVYGGSAEFPTTLAFSKKNDFDNFEPDDRGIGGENPIDVTTDVQDFETRDTDSFIYTLQEGDASQINWIVGTPRGMMVATDNAVHVSRQVSGTSAYSANNFELKLASYDGGSRIQPVFSEGRTYYIGDKRNKVFSLGFDFSTDVYASREESIFSDHLFEGEIEQIAFARSPIQAIWMTLSTGDLISMVFLSEQEQRGFFKHRIAGPQYSYESSTDSNRKTYINSICILPQTDLKPEFDQLYLATERDSATDADFIERLTHYPMNRDINLFNTLDMSINPFTESSTITVTAVDREDTAGVETLTLTATGHGLSATDTFALGNFEGGYSYLNGGALYTVDSVSGDDVIVTPARTPGGPTDYSEPYSGTGYIFKQDLTHTVSGDAFQLSEPDMIEKGILVDPDDYSWALSGSDSVLTMSSTTEGFIYSFGYYPDIYITTLPDSRANQQGRGEPYLSGISKLLFKLINTRNLTVQRVSDIQTTLSIPLVVSPATQTAGESAIYLDGKYEVLPEQTQDDREAEFKIVPETGYPINILSIYKRGEKGSR